MVVIAHHVASPKLLMLEFGFDRSALRDREYGAESQERRSPGDVDRHASPQPGLDSTIDHQQQRNQSEQLQRRRTTNASYQCRAM